MSIQLIKFPNVSDIIQSLLNEIKIILKDHFVGMYIHGSLAIGDFDPMTSDIDFLVVTTDVISEDEFNALRQIHAHLIENENVWARKLEGSYIPQQCLLYKEPPSDPRPYINEGKFLLEPFGYEWVLEQHTIREYGITIEGPAPQTLINPFSTAELQSASIKILTDWWLPMLQNTNRLNDCIYKVYAVLTMCRVLYMFVHGKIVSKKKAAEWICEIYNEKWGVLVGKALAWNPESSFENDDEVLEFIQFTISYCSRYCKSF
ncbi:aminoglycoside adenylyltransferase domain-containing protein [Anaerosolibacter sp.]|uniref:aminoglycoside adenylyltransferase domain-containing protein n=1 Tax=Anaerosolibacter sp. TaxID=1872527 RepID=UPI0039EF2B56